MLEQVKLHPELRLYLEDGQFFPMLKHPLIFAVPYFEGDNERLNKYFEQKKEQLSKALIKGDYSSYVFLHERPYRLMALTRIAYKITDYKEYWELLGDVWTDSENIWQNKKEWKNLLTVNYPFKEYFMSEEDRKEFENLPDKLKVYRGYVVGQNKQGFSYTLDKEKAIWFSKRFNKSGAIEELEVDKEDIFAYTNARNEQEVIILPKRKKREKLQSQI